MTDDFEIKFMTERLRITIERAEAAENRIEELEAQNKRLRDQMRLYHISVEALSEIKASVDGKSDQPVADIIYGLLDEIAKAEKEERG